MTPLRLLELIVDSMDMAEKTFNHLIRDHIADREASARIFDGTPTLKQKFSRLRNETMTTETLGSILGGAASALGA